MIFLHLILPPTVGTDVYGRQINVCGECVHTSMTLTVPVCTCTLYYSSSEPTIATERRRSVHHQSSNKRGSCQPRGTQTTSEGGTARYQLLHETLSNVRGTGPSSICNASKAKNHSQQPITVAFLTFSQHWLISTGGWWEHDQGDVWLSQYTARRAMQKKKEIKLHPFWSAKIFKRSKKLQYCSMAAILYRV